MVIHEQLNRAYIAMKEGGIFVFDISEAYPVIKFDICGFNNARQPDQFSRLSIDTSINQIYCLSKLG